MGLTSGNLKFNVMDESKPIQKDDGGVAHVVRGPAVSSKLDIMDESQPIEEDPENGVLPWPPAHALLCWDDWLSGSGTGRMITLVTTAEVIEHQSPASRRIPATFYVVPALSRLAFIPIDFRDMPPVTVSIKSIQAICPAKALTSTSNRLEKELTDTERVRAVLLRHASKDHVSSTLCFIEDSDATRDLCIQTLVGLWLRLRNDHPG